MIRARIVGAGGYGGVGVTELLLQHPAVELVGLSAATETGMAMSALHPHLAGFCDLPIRSYETPEGRAPADVVFFATPDGVAMRHAAAELEAGARVIDFSGDFRFGTAAAYADYATRAGLAPEHQAPELLDRCAYGLAELGDARLGAETEVVGNAGCFAASALLGLAPAVALGLVNPARLVCDAKTGVSGAGKKPAPGFHYPARYENMNAYKLAGHQHVCEIEQQLERLGGQPARLTFTAQVVPMCRGILSCLYGELREGTRREAVLEAYREWHRDHPFVRIFDRSAAVGTAHVRGSNYGNLIVDADERTGLLRVVSHIDNLVKGQSGNAVQNMNVLFGLPQTTGLDRPGTLP